MKHGASVGVLAGLASGVVFGILVYVAASAMLSVSVSLGLVVLEAIAGGAATGLCAGLVYSGMHERLPGESCGKKALAITTLFALPWGLLWVVTLPLSFSAGSDSYMIFIHKLGMETPWVQIPSSSQQVMDLEGLIGIGACFTVYLLLLFTWVLMFGLMLGNLWDKRIQK